MATHKISMLGSMTSPDNSGGVWFEPASARFDLADNIYDHLLLVYEDSGSVAEYCYGSFKVPENYSGTAKVELVWAENTTDTGALDFDFGYTAIATNEAGAPAVEQDAVNLAHANSATEELKQAVEVSLTDADFSPSDTVLWRLSRDSDNDGIAVPVYVFELNFIYDD